MLYTSRWPREVSSEMRVDSLAKGFSGSDDVSVELMRGENNRMSFVVETVNKRLANSLVHLHII